jgi:hypothetical protein
MGQNEKEEHGAGRHEKVYRWCLETNATLDLDIQFFVFLFFLNVGYMVCFTEMSSGRLYVAVAEE